MTPNNVDDWADVHRGISSFKSTKMIYVYRPQLQTPPVNLKVDVRSEVGGFLGMGTSVCTSQIIFEKNQYYLGEHARVRIICDNTNCEKDVRTFKFKLMRRYIGRETGSNGAIGHWKTEHSDYLITQKSVGLEKGKTSDLFYEIAIPT